MEKSMAHECIESAGPDCQHEVGREILQACSEVAWKVLAIALLCPPAFGQATSHGGKYSGSANYALQGQGLAGVGENFYCLPGTVEFTEGVPTWGANDGIAQLPTRCINTALASTPGGTHIGGAPATT